jgi:hypothetical protein
LNNFEIEILQKLATIIIKSFSRFFDMFRCSNDENFSPNNYGGWWWWWVVGGDIKGLAVDKAEGAHQS